MTSAATNDSKKASSQKKYPAPQHPTIRELKKKYESNNFAAPEIPMASPQLSRLKMFKKSKVKQIASMYNFRISQITRPDFDNDKYANLVNEISPNAEFEYNICLPKPPPITKIRCDKEKPPIASPRSKSKSKAQEKTMCSMSEDNFAQLTVKQKAQLYTQFIAEMSTNNPEFYQHAEIMEANTKREEVRGEVVHEKQETVKHLLKELESRCEFPRQTISPLALQRLHFAKKGFRKPIFPAMLPRKPKEFEDIYKKVISHISTLTVTLEPSHTAEVKKERRSRSLPRQNTHEEQDFKKGSSIEPCHKRTNAQMRSSLPIEAYAPPKKIRRTRSERLAPRIFFQNLQLENLFFSWLSERRLNVQAEVVNATGKEIDTLSDETIDTLLDETIAKLENLKFEEKNSCAMAAKATDTKAQKIAKLAPRKKRPAPPVPVNNTSTTSSQASTISWGKSLESEESESGLSYLPKITTDESQPDAREKESDNSEKNEEFKKPLKPLRKKKLRRTLAVKKYTPFVKTQAINSTDSDTDYKLAGIEAGNDIFCLRPETMEIKNSATAELPTEQNSEELDKTFMCDINSTEKVKSAYTLKSFSSTPCQQEDNINDLDSRESAKQETSNSWLSSVCNQIDQKLSLNSKVLPPDITGAVANIDSRSFTDSFIDQGFETGSNDMDSPVRAPKRTNLKRQDAAKVLTSEPLFIKLSQESQTTEIENQNPSSFSTPIKEHLQQPAHFGSTSFSHQQLVSPIALPLKSRRKSTYDTETRRSSSAMQVIREDQPLEHHEITSPRNFNSTEEAFLANASTLEMPTNLSDLSPNKTSQFWIKSGYFSVSLDIFYNDAERVRLLYEIFSQKSCDNKDLHFGIDNQKFSVHHLYDQENIGKRLPDNKQCSHYWFSTGDLAIPFSGKVLSADKIKRLFEFIKASVEESGILRFGVDAVEFSNVCEFWTQPPKFSMDSNYSMLVGLQSGNSNGLEGRSKFAWPHSKPVQVSDLDRGDCEYKDFEENESYRLSFSPFSSNHFDLAALSSEELSMPRISEAMINGNSFGAEYENESLDNLFDGAYNPKGISTNEQQNPVPQMLNTLKTQQKHLSLLHEKLSRYNNPANLSSEDLDALKGTPEYLKKLKSIVAEITRKGLSSGFKDCTILQLESYMFILSRYADICLNSCSDHIEKVLDALLDQRAVVV